MKIRNSGSGHTKDLKAIIEKYMKRILIISDGKPGHLNQSIAFCKIKDISYDILEVKFKSKFHKALSYLLDKFDFFFFFYLKIIKNSISIFMMQL